MPFSLNHLLHEHPLPPMNNPSADNWIQDPFQNSHLNQSNNNFLTPSSNVDSTRPAVRNLPNGGSHIPNPPGYQSVHSFSVPAANIFDGTAHLRLQDPQILAPPPSYTSSSPSNGPENHTSTSSVTNTNPKDLLNPKIPIHVLVNEKSNTNSRKRKPSALSNVPTTKKVPSVMGKIKIVWDSENRSLVAFQDAVIAAIGSAEGDSVGFFVQDHHMSGNIEWFVAIPFGGSFATNHKRRLNDEECFLNFLSAAEGVSENRKITCTLVQKYPKVLAEVGIFLFTVHFHCSRSPADSLISFAIERVCIQDP